MRLMMHPDPDVQVRGCCLPAWAALCQSKPASALTSPPPTPLTRPLCPAQSQALKCVQKVLLSKDKQDYLTASA